MMPERLSRLVEILEAHRLKRHITLHELERRTGISRQAYYRWVIKKSGPRLAEFLIVAEALGLDFDLAEKGESHGRVSENRGGRRDPRR